MKQATIGIIGGTGLGEVLLGQAGGTTVPVDTPFGPPSCDPILACWEGVDVAYISRHGPGHHMNPSIVPYRANIFALKQLGVSGIIASGATGSLREEIEPGHLVLCDQTIDKTFRREGTFFNEPGLVVHVEFADPFCSTLRDLLRSAADDVDTTVHHAGTYVCMEGPQFSTRAESNMHRAWGGDLIGMTCMPEARLAREAELCYALVALPTDYDCWRPVKDGKTPDELLPEIIGNLKRATANAMALIQAAVKRCGDTNWTCRCHDALKLGMWSDKSKVTPEITAKLEPLIGRYMTDK